MTAPAGTLPIQAPRLDASAASPIPPGATGPVDLRTLLMSGGILLLAFGWLFHSTFAWILNRWRYDEYYSHGPLLPFIAAYLIWRKREEIARAWASPRSRDPWILPLLFVTGLFTFFSLAFQFRDTQGLCIPLVLLVIVRFMAGPAVERQLRFPLLYLLLAMPPKTLLMDSLTGPMQIKAASLAAVILGLLGIGVDRQGVNLYTAHYSFVVAVPCSGLKTAITLLALTILVAHILPDLTNAQRWALCLLSMPIAVLSNAIRVAAIVVIGHFLGVKMAEGFLHGFSGILTFLVAFGMLMALGKLLAGRRETFDSDEAADPERNGRESVPESLRVYEGETAE